MKPRVSRRRTTTGRLGPEQTIEFAAHYSVTFAGSVLQAFAIADRDVSAPVFIRPARCKLPAMTVTPERRAPSICERNSCVSSNSSPSTRSWVMSINESDPNGIRTRVTAVKGRCPRPLDDRVKGGCAISEAPSGVASYLQVLSGELPPWR